MERIAAPWFGVATRRGRGEGGHLLRASALARVVPSQSNGTDSLRRSPLAAWPRWPCTPEGDRAAPLDRGIAAGITSTVSPARRLPAGHSLSVVRSDGFFIFRSDPLDGHPYPLTRPLSSSESPVTSVFGCPSFYPRALLGRRPHHHHPGEPPGSREECHHSLFFPAAAAAVPVELARAHVGRCTARAVNVATMGLAAAEKKWEA